MSDNTLESQIQVKVQEEFAFKERYQINETKTKTMTKNAKKGTEDLCCVLNGETLGNASEYKHVGLLRHSDLKIANTKLIDDRLSTARRTAYALMGAGLHGGNGLYLTVATTIYTLYVLPRLVYGLESVLVIEAKGH